MTRPAILIGLGGTGQWVLTFVKKELFEINNQQMPSNVRLLAFDTLPQATAETERAGGDKEVKVGKVKLEKDIEFIHIGGNVYDLSQRTKDSKEPHIGSWFQADYFLNTLPPAAFNLSAGAGAIRPMGRLGLFNDMQSPSNSELWSRLTTAIQAVRNEVNAERQLEIIIISSLAGGTGSGMFLDVANLVRNAAKKEVAGNFILRGVFVLPGAFPHADRLMNARAFAAWRELDRFMFNDQNLGRRTIEYNYQNSQFHFDASARLFDGCYLLDPARPDNPLTGLEPERGIFPCVADIVSAILDSTAGERFTEYVTANLVQNLKPGVALHSSLGAFTIQVPMYYMIQEASHKLAMKFLDDLLAPNKDDRTGKITGLKVNQNPNAPTGLGMPGADEALSFLAQSNIARQGAGSVTPTLLPSEIHNILTRVDNRQPHTDSRLVIEHAQSSLSTSKGKNTLPWLTPFSSLGSDDRSREIERDISDGVNTSLDQKVPTLDKEEPSITYNRIVPRIDAFKREYLGTQASSGEFIGGKFRMALEKCADEHVRRFRQTLRMELLNILMPENHEGAPPNVGTLGYALDFANGLVLYLNYFITFMDAVETERMGLQPHVEQAKKVAKARDLAKSTMHKKGMLGIGFAAEAHSNIDKYKAAEQQLINIYKSQLLHDAVKTTSARMRDYARMAAQELNNWAVQMAVGDAASGTRSLYELLAESHDYVESSRKFDELVQKVRQPEGEIDSVLTNDEFKRHLTDLLGRVTWDVNAEADKFTVSLDIEAVKDSEGNLISPGSTFTSASRVARKNNLDALRSVVESYLGEVMRTNAVASVLADKALSEAGGDVAAAGGVIADMLNGKGEPLYDFEGQGPGQTSCFVRVHYRVGQHETEETFDVAQQRLQQKMPKRTVRLFDSDDKYKCTVVRSDDLIESRYFKAWQKLHTAYIDAINDRSAPVDPRVIHILPAEVNASDYERQLPRLGMSHRIFEPKVVMMLEDERRVRQFFLAYILGFIEQGREGNQSYYQLNVPGVMREPLWLTMPQTGLADIFNVMNSFVNEGRDARPGRSGVVDYDKVDAALDQYMAELANGDDAMLINRLEKELSEQDGEDGEDGEVLSSLMRAAGARYSREQANLRGKEYEKQEYADLADVLRLVLTSELDQLRSRAGSPATARITKR